MEGSARSFAVSVVAVSEYVAEGTGIENVHQT